MSDQSTVHVHPHTHDAEGHALTHHEVGAHGTLRSYLIGFGLSVVLTAIPFWLVMSGAMHGPAAAITILAIGAVQIVVHMIYFLHMSTQSEGGWSIMALIFTIVLVIIALTGSIWVMYHLNSNMSPMTAAAASQLP